MSPAERKPLSWEPRRYVHEGVARYCAPACGHHCTVESWREAQTFAGACARDLGDGWIPRVHENMGWHSGARFEIEPSEACERPPDVQVSVRTDPLFGDKRRVRGYWASVSGAGSQWTGDGATAPAALAAAVAMGVDLASREIQLLTALAGTKEANGIGYEATRLVRVLAAAIEVRSEPARPPKTKRGRR